MSSIVVKNLGKAYKRYAGRWDRLREWMSPHGKRVRHTLKWVLQGVSFVVNPGESVGIVGINGAGKSTLLKIITGTTQATTGDVQINGRVAALLELGMGFHPDFTGRQNAVMAGQILGYGADEIIRLMPEIEAFAEIGEYIDQPVRVYSSGMQVRLAFSVATAIRPDVLIVDEALSVGDRFFSQKSFSRIQAFLDEGTTLLFVSHDSTAIKALCDRAILLDKGVIRLVGDPETVIDFYNGQLLERANEAYTKKPDDVGTLDQRQNAGEMTGELRHVDGFRERHAQVDTGEIKLTEFWVHDSAGQQVISVTTGNEVTITYRVRALANLDDLYFGVSVRNNLGISIFNTTSQALGQPSVSIKQGESIDVFFTMKLPIQPGNYGLCMGVASRSVGAGSFDRYLLNVINAEVLEVTGTSGNSRFGGLIDLSPAFRASTGD